MNESLGGGQSVRVEGSPDEATEDVSFYVVPIVFTIVFIIGLVGNGSIIWIILRNETMRTVSNVFLLNLAMGDLLVLVFSVPFTAATYTLDSWPFGGFMCNASEFAKDTSVGVSVFTLVALCLERRKVIVHPVRSFVSDSKTLQTIVSLTVIWLISTLLALPAAVNSHLMVVGNATQSIVNVTHNFTADQLVTHFVCYPFPAEYGHLYAQTVVVGRLLFHYLIPLVIISSVYISSARHLLRSTSMMATHSEQGAHPSRCSHQQPNADAIRSRRKVANMAVWLVMLFAVCFLPWHVYFVWMFFSTDPQANFYPVWDIVKIVGFCLAYSNSCVNPMALYIYSSKFRHHFNQILCCCCPYYRAPANRHVQASQAANSLTERTQVAGADSIRPSVRHTRQSVAMELQELRAPRSRARVSTA